MKVATSFKLWKVAHFSHVRIAPIAILLLLPLAAHAQGTPFDTGFQALQNLFTARFEAISFFEREVLRRP